MTPTVTLPRLALVAMLMLSSLAAHARQNDRAQDLRLVVLVVVDQLRADYLDVYRHRWRSGFRILTREGAYFPRARYPYMGTETCPGHASISTGSYPRTHGLVSNSWWSRAERRRVACVQDEASAHVSFGGPARSGSSARWLLVPTLADELRGQHPGSQVAALSFKARSSVTLAGRGGDAVIWFDDASRSFVTSRAYASGPVQAVQDFISRDAPDADRGRTWSLQDRAESYRFDDDGRGERPGAGWTALFPHPLSEQGADEEFFARWQRSPFADAYLGRMAAAVVDNLQLGRRSVPDYLAISFAALDLVGHGFGPDSREAEDVLIRLDATLGALIQHLDKAVGRSRYTLALTADHGVASIPETRGAGRILGPDIQAAVERALTERWGKATSPRYVASVGSEAVYFWDGAWERLRNDGPALDAVTSALMALPGVDRVLRGDRVSPTDADPVVRAAALSYMPDRSGDLIVVPKRNWVVGLRAGSNHGTHYEYDQQVPIVLLGHGIRRGRYATVASPADVAPTLAALANVRLNKTDGRVLKEALK